MDLIHPGAPIPAGLQVGGKAAGLLAIRAAGLATPEFFVVPAGAHRAHLRHASTAALIGTLALDLADTDDAVAAAAKHSAALREAVVAVPLDAGLTSSVMAALGTLGPGPYAVRSSMVGEDSERHSFAGQLDSVLQCPADRVPVAVKACWASAYSEHALAYATRSGIPIASLAVAVVVQAMFEPDVAGVLFTADPSTGRRDRCRVAATYGLGEGVVSGRCDADEFVYHRESGHVDAHLAHKGTRIVTLADGGVGEEPVTADLRDGACLDDTTVASLCATGIELEATRREPLDIEWALAGAELVFLQARPVTVPLAPDPAATAVPLVWDNSNIQESFCGVTTPLTFSFASWAYETVFVQTCKAAGLSAAQLEAARPLFANLIGFVDGRVYYNLMSWYATMRLLPSFGLTKENFERAVGVTDPVDFVTDEVLSGREKLARVPRLAANAALVVPAFARLRRDIAAFHQRFAATVATIDRGGLVGRSYAELVAVLDRIDTEIAQKWTAPIVNDFVVQLTCGAVERAVESIAAGDGAAVTAGLFSANDGIESVEPTLALFAIADTVRHDAGAAAALATGTPAEGLGALREARPDVADALDSWLDRYGDRCMGELKLETVSLRDDPRFVASVLRGYVARADLTESSFRDREQEHYDAAVTTMAEKLGPRRWAIIRRVLARAREAVREREAMRLTRTRMFGLYRDVFTAMGARLHEAGRIEQPRDVFYLTREELRAHNDGRAVTTDMAALVAVRKAELARHEEVDAPDRFETARPPYDTRIAAKEVTGDAPPDAGATLHGIACYPGVVEADARVVAGPGDALDLDGRILVAVRTDPGWTPLFPTAGGILVERGSSLSHSAVVARELGIPAIVGVEGLTTRVRDGDPLRMDGARGTVQLTETAARGTAGGGAE